MTGDNYGIQHSGTGDVINHGVQAFGPGAHAGGTAAPSEATRGGTRPKHAVPTGQGTTVFVSYAHDTDAHKTAVLALAELLTGNGVHVEIDQWAGITRRDWGAWAITNIKQSDFVLVIASPRYHRVGDGGIDTSGGRGAQAESAVIRDLLYSDRAEWVPKLLPVVLPGHDVSEIPIFLQPYSLDHYIVRELTDRGVAELLRVLTGQPSRVRPKPGPVPKLPPARSPG